jgi:hypothetical protein
MVCNDKMVDPLVLVPQYQKCYSEGGTHGSHIRKGMDKTRLERKE